MEKDLEKNKFYVPEIEEFHIGFEFEYLPHRRNWVLELSGDKWIKETFSGSCGIDGESEVYEITSMIEDKHCRVKHLDREDIESLGWEHQRQGTYTRKEEDLHFYFLKTLSSEFGDNKIEIRCAHPSLQYGNFLGECKNKSELKRVLKQLGI